MTSSFSVRDAVVEDLDALLDLYQHMSPSYVKYSLETAQDRLLAIQKYDGSAVLVGEVEGALVATCTLIIIPNLTRGGRPYALIENVVTHSDHLRKGFGTAILDAASQRAWAEDCYKIMLSTGSKTPSILAFYEAAGFEQSRTGFQKRKVEPRSE